MSQGALIVLLMPSGEPGAPKPRRNTAVVLDAATLTVLSEVNGQSNRDMIYILCYQYITAHPSLEDKSIYTVPILQWGGGV